MTRPAENADPRTQGSLVTVITPTYNRAAFLSETIESVLSQSYSPLEYIIIDDGSTDDTAAVLTRYGDRINVVSHPNMGETGTVNKGLRMARGEFVMVVNSDDPLRPGAIEVLARALADNPAALLAYPDWDEIDEQGDVLKTLRLPQYDIGMMLREFNIPIGPGALVRRHALEEVGVRRPNFRYGGDVDLLLRMALAGPIRHVPEVLATHRVHRSAASTTGKGWRMAWEVSQFARATLADRRIPSELRRDRHLILWNAHGVALGHYCGDDARALAYHRARVCWHGALAWGMARLRGDQAVASMIAERGRAAAREQRQAARSILRRVRGKISRLLRGV